MTGSELHWRKSSYSTDNGNCVEIAWPTPTKTAVRDSKHDGPTLTFSTPDWRLFLSRLG